MSQHRRPETFMHTSSPKGMSREGTSSSLDALKNSTNRSTARSVIRKRFPRINQYELAYRMQISVPEVMDIKREKQVTLDEYGAQPGKASFANNCLLARRLVEQGAIRAIVRLGLGFSRNRRTTTTSYSVCRSSARRTTSR